MNVLNHRLPKLSLIIAILAVAGAYLLAFSVQVQWLTEFDRWIGISAFYLPHGVRVISAMILRAYSIPGLWLASIVGSWFIFGEFNTLSVMASFCSAVFPYASMALLDRVLSPDRLLARLNMSRFALIVVMSGLANSLTTNLVFATFAVHASFSWTYVGVMWLGDVFGAACVIAIIWGTVRFVKRFILVGDHDYGWSPKTWLEAIGLVAGGYITLHYITWAIFRDPMAAMPWLCLPAALRILASLSYGVRAIPGLFLGMLAVETAWESGWMSVGLAILGSSSAFAGIWCWEQIRGRGMRYEGLSVRDATEITILAVLIHGMGFGLLITMIAWEHSPASVSLILDVLISHFFGAMMLVVPVIWIRGRIPPQIIR